ncbi:serine/threonine-protein kinase, partial [Undibacterium danionis]
MSASTGNVTNAKQLLHYQLGESLGEGGFGQVFRAWDDKLHRHVAIKYLKNLTAGVDLVKEARLAASLQHPAFVKVHALEQSDDGQAIVMELVPGRTLRQLMETEPPSIPQILDIVRQIAQAMQEAHDAGLIHGDLKPSNLMLDEAATRRKQSIPTPKFKITILSQAFNGEGTILRRIDHESR